MEIQITENIKVEVEFSDNTVRINDCYNSDCLIVWSLEEFDKIVKAVREQTNTELEK